MIRDAVLHLFNEQPLVADLYRLPDVGDLGLLCTNLRQLNGTRPVFVDDLRSTFFFPYAQIRFVEIPPASIAAAGVVPGVPSPAVRPAGVAAAPSADAGPPGLPAIPEERAGDGSTAGADEAEVRGRGREATGADASASEARPEPDLDIDEDFLRRIRAI